MHKYMALALLALPTASALAEDLRKFSADDVFELEYADDPQISPDGRRIVYERMSNDIMTDRTRANLWIVDVGGGNHRPLVSGTESASSPRWSPGGDRIAYVRSTDTGTGIFVRWMDTGATALVANLQKSPSHLAWSPDGDWIAFVMSVRIVTGRVLAGGTRFFRASCR